MIFPSTARTSGGPVAPPSLYTLHLYRRTAEPDFDKSLKKFCFFLSSKTMLSAGSSQCPVNIRSAPEIPQSYPHHACQAEGAHCKSLTANFVVGNGRFWQPLSKLGHHRALVTKMQRRNSKEPAPRIHSARRRRAGCRRYKGERKGAHAAYLNFALLDAVIPSEARGLQFRFRFSYRWPPLPASLNFTCEFSSTKGLGSSRRATVGMTRATGTL